MAGEETTTDFEWLDRPFMLTRIWVTLVATVVLALLAYETVYLVMFVRLGPPPPPAGSPDGPEEAETVRTEPFGPDRPPPIHRLAGMTLSSLLAGSVVVLVWLRPRAGFLLAAFAGLPIWMGAVFLPAAWLCFAAWKVSRAPPNGILPPCS